MMTTIKDFLKICTLYMFGTHRASFGGLCVERQKDLMDAVE